MKSKFSAATGGYGQTAGVNADRAAVAIDTIDQTSFSRHPNSICVSQWNAEERLQSNSDDLPSLDEIARLLRASQGKSVKITSGNVNRNSESTASARVG
jgi:hypothetical protein